MVQPNRPEMTILYGAWALHAGKIRLQKHAHNTRIMVHVFPLQNFLLEWASILRYNSIVSLVYDPSNSSNSNVYLLICYTLLMHYGYQCVFGGSLL